MQKKRILLVTLLVSMLFIVLASSFVSAEEEGCCYGATMGCQVVFDEGECNVLGGTYSPESCSADILRTECSVGCCVTQEGALRVPKHKVSCTEGDFTNAADYEQTPSSDICGGILECSEDSQCPANTRCENGICIPGQRAQVDKCENGVQDPGETDVDCGGNCPRCDVGKSCGADSDCQAGQKCDPDTNKCVEHVSNCRNGVVDEGEDCDFEEGSNQILYKQGVNSCVDLDHSPGQKYTGGTLSCNSFCRFETSSCTYLSPDQRRTEATGICGDGVLNTPNEKYVTETCEIGIDRCGAGQVCGCTNPDECQPSDCTCRGECEVGAPVITLVDGDAVPGKARIIWDVNFLPEACPLISQHVLYCKRGEENCPQAEFRNWKRSAEIAPVRRMYEKDIGEEKGYCFAVETTYQGQEPQISDFICLDACIEGQTFCDNTDPNKKRRTICQGGDIQPGPACTGQQYCAEPEVGLSECREPEVCQKCNGVFELFGGVLFDQIGVLAEQTCEEVQGCIYDLSKKNVNYFRSCKEIQDCYSYRSKYACENDVDHCQVSAEGCEWLNINEDLGLGVCKPALDNKEQCDLCNQNNKLSNNLLLQCDRDMCEAFGDTCYFSAGKNSCGDESGFGCSDYNDVSNPGRARTECTGGRAVRINANYHAESGKRIGGTNEIVQRSQDRFNHGLCTWGGEPGDRCFKDADGDGLDDCRVEVAPDKQACETDFTPPETSVALENVQHDQNNKMMLGKFMDVPVRVTEKARTFYCLGQNCYPTEYTMCRIQRVLGRGDQTATKLSYYSQDFNQNLEVIKDKDIVVNVNRPRQVKDRTLAISQENPRQLRVNLEYTRDVTCNGMLTNIKGEEVFADDSPQARVNSNRIADERGKIFTREYHNLEDNIYVFNYDCTSDFGNTDSGYDVQLIDTNKIHIASNTYGGSEPIVGSEAVIARVTTDEPADCFIKPLGTNREYTPFAAQAQDAMRSEDRLNHNKNLPLEGDLNVFQVACQFDGEDQLQGNKADRIIVSKDKYGPELKFYASIDKSIDLESGDYGTAQNVFLYCSDKRIEEQYGLRGLDNGCGEVSMTLNGEQVGFAFDAAEPEGFMAPFTPYIVGNEAFGGSAVLEVKNLVARDREGHAAEQFVLEPFKITVADNGNGQIADPAVLTLHDELGGVIPHQPPPRLGKGVYFIKINTGRIASLENFRATLTATGFDESGVAIPVPNKPEFDNFITEENCQLDSLSTIKCMLNLEELQLAAEGEEELGLYSLEINVGAVKVVEKGTECFPDENPLVSLNMQVEQLTITLRTQTPELELDPIFSPSFFAAGEEWDTMVADHHYPISFYPSEGLAYTNQPELFISGIMKHPEITESIQFYQGICGSQPSVKKSFTQPVSNVVCRTSVNTPESRTNVVTTNNPAQCGVLSGKFMEFAAEVEDDGTSQYSRKDYTKYRHNYQVVEQGGGTPTPLTLDSDIEQVPEPVEGVPGIEVNFYTGPAEPGVFGDTISLDEGCNIFYAKGLGDGAESRIVPDPAAVAGIVVDTEGPLVIENIPAEGTTNEVISEVGIIVEEVMGGAHNAELIPETITMSIIPIGDDESIEDVEQEPVTIDGPGCQDNICQASNAAGFEYSYNLVIDRLTDEATREFIEDDEKETVLQDLGWDGLHEEYIAEASQGQEPVAGVIQASVADETLSIQTEEIDGKKRHTIMFTPDAPLEGGHVIRFEGMDKATNNLAPTTNGKPEWVFNSNDGTPIPPVFTFLEPAVEFNGTFYSNRNVNVQIDYSENPEEVTILDEDSSGRIFYKAFDAPLGQEDPLPSNCEQTQRNVFVCNLADLGPEQFNQAYTIVAEARMMLSTGSQGPSARHASPTLVLDNQAPEIIEYDFPPIVAYSGKLRIQMKIKDSGFDMKGRFVFDVPEMPHLKKEGELVQVEHQVGSQDYIFEWDLEPERFNIQHEEILKNPQGLTLFFDDYAGNAPPAYVSRDLKLDFRGPSLAGWAVDINTPHSIPAENKYFTKESSVKINGSFADDDICEDCIFITPGNYLRGGDTFDPQLVATKIHNPPRRFTTNLQIKAVDGEVVNQSYMIVMKDMSGFNKSKEFTIFTDRRPPEEVGFNIR